MQNVLAAARISHGDFERIRDGGIYVATLLR